MAGFSYTNSTDLFFHNDLSHLIKCSSSRNLIPEVIDVDFYDKTDTIFDKVAPMIYRIPRGTNLFLSFDIGLVDDITGGRSPAYGHSQHHHAEMVLCSTDRIRIGHTSDSVEVVYLLTPTSNHNFSTGRFF